MRNIFGLVFIAILAVGATKPAQALLPESGYYWNENLPGMGFSVEFQDDFFFLAAYTYSGGGSAIFFTIQGMLDVAAGKVTGSLILATGGSCIGCAATSPNLVEVAPAEVQFIDNRSGIIRIFFQDGTAQIPIERFVFFLDDNTPNGELLGSWSNTSMNQGLHDGEAMLFLEKAEPPNGFDLAFSGHRIDTNRPLVGARINGTQTWVVLLDSSASFWRRWIFTRPTPNRWTGLRVVYGKNDPSPSLSSGIFSISYRMTGRRTIDQIIGSTNDSKALAEMQEIMDALAAEQLTKDPEGQRAKNAQRPEFAEIFELDDNLMREAVRALERTLLERIRQ